MKRLFYQVNNLPYAISIGKVGENGFRPITFDLTPWTDEFPDATVTLTYKRPDGQVYSPAAIRNGSLIVWTPSNTDLAVKGCGSLELKLTNDTVVGKSATVEVRIDKSVEPTGEIPSPYQSWYEDIVNAGIKAQQFLDIAEGGENGQIWMKTENGPAWVSVDDIPDMFMHRLGTERIAPYLFNAKFKELDYAAGEEYYEQFRGELGNCSVVVNGNLVGRNFDFNYDEVSYFVLHTPAVKGRHAVIGLAAAHPEMSQAFIESGEYSENYKVVPFLLRDGVNDAGLFCEINVCPTGDKGITTGSNPDGEDMYACMIPRYVLDHAGSVDEAIALIASRNIFAANSETRKQEFHFLLHDSTKTAVIEFIENEMVVIEDFVDDKPIMTNLYLYGYDGSRESLTPHACGIERQQILTDGYGTAGTVEGMISLMQSVMYTKTYSDLEDPLWLSEFNGDYTDTPFAVDLTIDSPPEDYEPIRNYEMGQFRNRKRDGETWHTVYTAVYDIEHRTIAIIPQESGEIYRFGLGHDGRIYEGG